ncbi:class I SAM-dependent methyltransferase [Alphaproteobacteria bacterium]|nr:class I SAM-dependent methyltransferase [Alphaproteobacteria bacterium]
MNLISKKNSFQGSEYWNYFYENHKIVSEIDTPSQFAAFTISEIKQAGISLVYDLGCGSGRDTKFFLDNDCDVIALDKSQVALQKTRSLCSYNERLCTSLTDFSKSYEEWPKSNLRKKALYARFLIHSLPNPTLEKFIAGCYTVMNIGDLALFEYRTTKDQSRFKEAPDHYRNYVDPNFIKSLATNNGLLLTYSVEGLGYAKYRKDDAFVSRQIFIKTQMTPPPKPASVRSFLFA